jgi:uncharacterized membrane protein
MSSKKNKKPSANVKHSKKIGSLLLLALAACAFVAVLYFANYDRPVYRSSNTSGSDYEVGRVLRVLEDNKVVDETTEGIWRGSMLLEIEILTGKYKGDVVEVTNYFSALYNIRVEEGDKVAIRTDTTAEGEYQTSIYNYYRVPQLIACCVFFIFLMIVIGGKKGAKSVGGLIFTIVCMIWILLPLALKGYSPLAVTIVLILLCNFVSFFLIDGVSTKAVVASLGSICGVLAGALFALIAQWAMSVTTFQMDEAETLLLITSTTNLEITDLFLCGILIACMGAVMDVAMSITSSIAELHEKNPSMGRAELFRSGMNIGRDAMGTMSNTLILAFAGNSFNMMLMIYSYGIGFQQLMNTDFVAIEVIRGIAGSIGIISTVPLVAVIASAAYDGKRRKSR